MSARDAAGKIRILEQADEGFRNGKLFNTQPLTWSELNITVAVSSIVFWAVEIQKLVIWQRDTEQEPDHEKPAVAAPVAD